MAAFSVPRWIPVNPGGKSIYLGVLFCSIHRQAPFYFQGQLICIHDSKINVCTQSQYHRNKISSRKFCQPLTLWFSTIEKWRHNLHACALKTTGNIYNRNGKTNLKILTKFKAYFPFKYNIQNLIVQFWNVNPSTSVRNKDQLLLIRSVLKVGHSSPTRQQ